MIINACLNMFEVRLLALTVNLKRHSLTRNRILGKKLKGYCDIFRIIECEVLI